MQKYKIEYGIQPPNRGPKRKFTDLPLETLRKGYSIQAAVCPMTRRPSTYNSVRKVIDEAVKSGRVKGQFTTSTRTLGPNSCEVRIFRVK